MKQIVQNFRTGILKVDDVPPPVLLPEGLLVANVCSLISAGTEKSTVSVAQKNLVGKAMDRPDMVRKVLTKVQKDGVTDTMKMVFSRLDTPAALGYSCAGRVVAVGEKVNGFSVGDRVACAGQNYASHAEVVSVPKNLCVKIPGGVDDEAAAFVTLGAIALQGVRQAEPHLGDRVAVIGLGLLGQLTIQMLKANGCLVIASDIDPGKLELAKKLGADEVVLSDGLIHATVSFTSGQGVDQVVITASTKENGPVELAGEIARRKGRVVVVGAVGMTLPREPYYKKELEFRLSTSYGPGRYDNDYEEKGRDYPFAYVRWTEQRNMEAFLGLIRQGKVDVKSLLTHRYSIDKAEQAYALIMKNREPYLGIMISYPIDEVPQRDLKVEVNKRHAVREMNLGLIGAGNHVRDMLIPQLQMLPNVSLRAVCTATGIKAKSLAEKIKAAYCTSDYREILKDDTTNAVLIGTRHNLHGSMVAEALSAGKHVFVEKPLCLAEKELEEIRAIYQEKSQKGLLLMVGFNRRFSPHAVKAKTFFRDRKDPLVMSFRVNSGALPVDHWTQDPEVGGGRILGEACHFIDYMQAICAARPVSVHARRIGRHTSGMTDDQSILSITFSDGSVGTVIYAAGGDTALAKERFEVFGGGKSLVMDDFVTSEYYTNGKKEVFKTGKRDKGFRNEIKQFTDAILQGGKVPIPFHEIEAVTRACFLALESMRTGEVYHF